MGKKLQWHKTYSDRYLVDREIIRLSFAEHGLLNVINCILRTQTNRVGCYIIRGRIGTLDELIDDAKRYAHKSRRGRNDVHRHAAMTLLSAHLLEQDEDGMIYSPYICQEVAENKVNEIHGRLGGNPGLTPPLRQKRREKKRREEKQNAAGVGRGDKRPADGSRRGPISIGDILEHGGEK